MPNPYEGLPSHAFWRTAVAERPALSMSELWHPRFCVHQRDSIATLGSCFAQNISRALVKAQYNWLNCEPAPPRFPTALKSVFQYDIYSARVGNIYTVALLKQWAQWAFGLALPSKELWREGDRYFDPFRPNIEPNGFASEAECFETRAQTIRALRTMFETCDVFIFTLGLTEAWINTEDGSVYPLCPGTVAGEYDADRHEYKNYTCAEIYADLIFLIELITQMNPGIKILMTVSPVPLTATASGNHVLVATIHSKSVLRAAVGDLMAQYKYIDYFPSYEIISAFPFKGTFFEANLRSVSKQGVDFVMQTFFTSIGRGIIEDGLHSNVAQAQLTDAPFEPLADAVCEDLMLDKLGRLG